MRTRRRTFLKKFAGGAAALGWASTLRAAGAIERVNVALIGAGSRGRQVMKVFQKMDNVAITHVCDPREDRLAQGVQEASGSVKTSSDLRRVVDDPALDAVIVGTPDHWHSPATIIACNGGKPVYVEKPCSHNIREGRLAVEAARRNKCLVQNGTQVRSTRMMQQSIALLREGIIGDVRVAKAWNIQRRESIGRGTPGPVPARFDFETWTGPATLLPYQQNRIDHWTWFYHYGAGDIGNDGIHDLEYARWGLGVDTHPSKVSALGGKYYFDDDQEFPDTQQVTFEYAGDGTITSKKMLIFEQRLWSTNRPRDVDSGAEFYGTKGQMFLSRRGKMLVWGDDNRSIPVEVELGSQNTDKHVENFVAAIRGKAQLTADIDKGHHTATLCHLGNISTRLGRSLTFDPTAETIVGDEEANRLVTRDYREHWGRPT